MDDAVDEPRFLVAELPEQIGEQVHAMFVAGWPIRARMRADQDRTCIDVRAHSPVDGVDDALVTLIHAGQWGVGEEATGLVSSTGAMSPQECTLVVEHMFSCVPAWLVPELSSEPHTGFVDLHDRLAVEDDPVLNDLMDRLESVFSTVSCAFGSGWDFTVVFEYREGSATIEMSTHTPDDLGAHLPHLVGDILDIDVRDMRMHWTFRNECWQLDTARTGFVGIADDATGIDVAELDTLCEAMMWAAANCVCDVSSTSTQWHSGGGVAPPSALPAVPLAPEPAPAPDVIAARARRLDAWAVEHGFSAPLEPTPAALIRHLDQVRAGRVGHYVLEFTDGQCYIGESIDLPERLRQHRSRYRDLHRIRVRPDHGAARSLQGKRHLRLSEKSLIHGAQDSGLLARNINEMATMIGTSKHLDQLVSAEEQRIWLGAPDVVNITDTVTRLSFPAERLARTAANYQHFRTRSDADQITRIIGRYLTRCIPYPTRTEHHCWAVSCLTTPGKQRGRVSCLTVAMTETLVIFQDRGTPAAGKIQVNETELFPTDPAMCSFFRRHPTARLSVAEYEESGPGQLFLHVDALDALERLLDDVAVTRAAATTALHIMRKGPCMQRKVHCPQLARAAFEVGFDGADRCH